MELEKIHFLKEDMLVVFPPTLQIPKYIGFYDELKESEKRYNSLIHRIANRRANLRGIITLFISFIIFIALNWFLIWLTPISEFFILSLAYMDCMYLRLAFAVIEDAFSTSWLTHIEYKGKTRNIIF